MENKQAWWAAGFGESLTLSDAETTLLEFDG